MAKPDERAVMTYVSCYYHAFSGLQKVKIFVKRISKYIPFLLFQNIFPSVSKYLDFLVFFCFQFLQFSFLCTFSPSFRCFSFLQFFSFFDHVRDMSIFSLLLHFTVSHFYSSYSSPSFLSQTHCVYFLIKVLLFLSHVHIS